MKTLIVLIRNIVAGLENCSLKQKDDIIQFFAPSSYSQPPPTPWSIQVLHPDPAGDEGGSAPPSSPRAPHQLRQGSSACFWRQPGSKILGIAAAPLLKSAWQTLTLTQHTV